MDVTRSGHTSATAGNSPSVSRTSATDEWEYEYDANRTDDFYFTLDVTTLQSQSNSKAIHTEKGKASALPNDQLQILDLHSDNPLVKLGDCFYSCRWSTDFGTQFYVAKPGIDENPLRRGHVLDVIGTSRARLTGEPVTLHRRKPDASEKAVGSANANTIVLDDDEDATNAVSTPAAISTTEDRLMRKNIKRLTTARQNARDPLVKAQASFLERLAIIKHKKGEKDAVPVYGIDTISRSTASGAISSGKRKSVPNGALDSPVPSNPTKKLLVSLPYEASGITGDFETSRIGLRESNNGMEARTPMQASVDVDSQLPLGETGSTSTATGVSGVDAGLSQTDPKDAVRPMEIRAISSLAMEPSPGQP